MPASINTTQLLGQLHSLVKQGKVANTTSKVDSSAAVAGWIVVNVYDTERTHGDNRGVLLEVIAHAMALYKGDI